MTALRFEAGDPNARRPLSRRRSIGVALIGVGVVLGVAEGRAGAAPNLDPFAKPRESSITGLWAQGAAAPAAKPKAAAPAKPAVQACTTDAECLEEETICEQGACRRIELATNIAYLYYRKGTFREILGLYWEKRGSSGYTVLFPIFWSYFTPTSRTRIVAPFFWRFEDHAARRTLTVIVPGLPISWSRQPDASSFGVWPLFYASTKFGWAAPLLGSFRVGDPDKGEATGAVAFLYWWQRKPDRKFDLLFPVFFSRRTAASAFTFALPLNFYWRTGHDARLLALPVLYWRGWRDGSAFYTPLGFRQQHRDGLVTAGSLLWLYWYGRDRSAGTAYDVLFPLVWSSRGPESGTTLVLPLLVDLRRPDARTTIVGPVGHIRRGGVTVDTVALLWWSGSSREGGWRFRTLFPLFFWQEREQGKKALFVSPIAGYSRDDQERSRTWVFPGVFVRRDPVRDLDILTPLYIRHRHHETDTTTRFFAILGYRRDDPAGSTTALFPLFWRFRDAASGATATAVLPVFFHRSAPHDTTTAVGLLPLAFFYRRQLADGGSSSGLFPLVFFGRRDDRSYQVVLGLFWRFSDAKGSTTALLPVFFRSADRRGYHAGVPLALTFFGSNEGRSYQIQFPLFWRFADERAGWSTAVTPLGFYGRSRDEGWRLGIGPLLPIVWAGGGGPRRHFVLFPLLWHFADDRKDESTTVALNYLHRRRGGETTDALFPLLYYRRGARPGGTDETSFTLFPLLHYRRDAHTRMLVTPLGASVVGPRRSGGFLGPYLWYRGPVFSARGIPLLYADVTNGLTAERTRQWGPFVAIDAPGRSIRVLFPLFGRYSDAAETDTFVFPGYFRMRKADGYAVDTFLPLFWRSRWRERTTTIIGPWYRRHGDHVHNTGLVPVFFWAKNDDRTLLVIPPLLTYHRHDFKANSSTTWAALFYHRWSPEHERTVLFPFWWSGRRGERSYRALAPLYWHVEDGAKQTSWTLAGPFYWSRHGPATMRLLLPLGWYTRNSETGTGTEALIPLFYAGHGPGRFTLLTLLFGYSRTPDARRWYVGPIYAGDSAERSVRVVFPVFVNHFNRSTETLTRLILPIHFSRTTPEASLSTWGLLFWRRTTVASATTLLLPVFYDVHDFHQSRTTVLFPLLFRHRNEGTGQSIWLAPLFYRRSGTSDSTTVMFPLFWDFRGRDRQTTVLFPLYAHWARPTHTGTYVFPNVYYRKGLAAPGKPDGTWQLHVFPLFAAAVDRPGDFSWEVLLGFFGKARIGQYQYLKVFFFNFQISKPSAVQTAWYGQPQRSRRAAPSRGLATNVW
jgi:hypothetical protein